jgi:hypothetical protein
LVRESKGERESIEVSLTARESVCVGLVSKRERV